MTHTLTEARRLARWWREQSFVRVTRLPTTKRYWAEATGKANGTPVERIDCTATSRRAALAGLCAALSVLVEDKR